MKWIIRFKSGVGQVEYYGPREKCRQLERLLERKGFMPDFGDHWSRKEDMSKAEIIPLRITDDLPTM